MSQAGGASQIGAISVGLGLDEESLRAGLRKSEAEVKASASRMSQSAKVSLFGDADVDARAGRLGGIGPGTGDEIRKVKDELQQAEQKAESFGQKLRGATDDVRTMERTFRLVTAGAAATVTVVNALAEASKYLTSVFGDGAKAAEEWYAKAIGRVPVGAKAAADDVKKLSDQLLQLNSELARNLEGATPEEGLAPYFTGRSTETIKQDIAKTLTELNAASRQAATERRNEERAERQRINAERQAEDLDATADYLEGQEEAGRKHLEIIKQTNDDETRLRDERLARAKQIQDAAEDKLGGSEGARHRREQEELEYLQMVERVGDAFEKKMAKAARNALLTAAADEDGKFAQMLKNAFLDAVNSAMNDQTSQYGFANMSTSLSNIQLTLEGMASAMPR